MTTDGLRRSSQRLAPSRTDDAERPVRGASATAGAAELAPSGRGEDRLLQDLYEKTGLRDELGHDEPLSRSVPLSVVLPKSLQSLPLPGLGGSPAGGALESRVDRALANLLGGGVDAMVLSSVAVGVGAKQKVQVEAFVAGSTLRFALARGKDGRDAIEGLTVAEPPMLTDPVQKQDLEDALGTAGHARAKVLAVADSDPFAQRSAVVVEEGGKKQALVLDRDGAVPKVSSFRYDDDEARSLALPLAIDAALAHARRTDVAAEVQVYVRAESLTPSDLVAVKPGGSPVRFDPRRQVQLEAQGLLGGQSVFVTFDRDKGTVQVDAAA
jgi:hypothetical protein